MKKGYREQIDVATELRGVGKQQSFKKKSRREILWLPK